MKNIQELIEKIKNEAKKYNQRRIIVLTGNSFNKHQICSEIINMYYNQENTVNILCLIDELSETSTSNKRLSLLKSYLDKKINLDVVEFGKTDKILGKTYDGLIIDFTRDLRAEDIGRTVETVKGGGLIVFLCPKFEIWKKMWLDIHRYFITPPYDLKDVTPIFVERIIKSLFDYDGIFIYEIDKNKVLKEGYYTPQIKIYEEQLKSNIVDKELVELCKTNDQLKLIEKIFEFYNSEKNTFILTADRGRGKTAGLGLSLAFLIKKGLIKKRVIITAQNYENVAVFFEFLKKGLEVFGYEFKSLKRKIKVEKIEIIYKPPLIVSEEKIPCDLIIIDEAASLPTTILFSIFQKYNKKIYSSTTHGYEGCGRGFSVRFLGRLRKMNINYDEFKLIKPIRYSEDDPIEKWLFKTFVLDAEPDELNENDLKNIENKNFTLVHPNRKEFILQNEEKLRSYFGIYILAHYRNSPLDLQLLADAPHHDVYYIELPSGKIVNAIQIAYEGNLSRETSEKILLGYDPSGNLIPCKIGQNYQDDLFPRKKGARIVRIASHPMVQGKGIGSKALELLSNDLKEKGFDWLGSSFGATKELIRFWVKNGFYIVHISPLKQRTSGEYSTIVVKPLNEKLKEIIETYSFFVKYKFLGSLLDAHRTIDYETALEILETRNYSRELFEKYSPRLSRMEIRQVEAFINMATSYETIYEIIRKLVYIYFLDPKRPELDRFAKKIFVLKILQNRKWKDVAITLKTRRKNIVNKIREAMKKLIDEYEIHLI